MATPQKEQGARGEEGTLFQCQGNFKTITGNCWRLFLFVNPVITISIIQATQGPVLQRNNAEQGLDYLHYSPIVTIVINSLYSLYCVKQDGWSKSFDKTVADVFTTIWVSVYSFSPTFIVGGDINIWDSLSRFFIGVGITAFRKSIGKRHIIPK